MVSDALRRNVRPVGSNRTRFTVSDEATAVILTFWVRAFFGMLSLCGPTWIVPPLGPMTRVTESYASGAQWRNPMPATCGPTREASDSSPGLFWTSGVGSAQLNAAQVAPASNPRMELRIIIAFVPLIRTLIGTPIYTPLRTLLRLSTGLSSRFGTAPGFHRTQAAHRAHPARRADRRSAFEAADPGDARLGYPADHRRGGSCQHLGGIHRRIRQVSHRVVAHPERALHQGEPPGVAHAEHRVPHPLGQANHAGASGCGRDHSHLYRAERAHGVRHPGATRHNAAGLGVRRSGAQLEHPARDPRALPDHQSAQLPGAASQRRPAEQP